MSRGTLGISIMSAMSKIVNVCFSYECDGDVIIENYRRKVETTWETF